MSLYQQQAKYIRVDVGFYDLSEIPHHSGICEADFTYILRMTSRVDVQTQESCLSDRDVSSEATTIFHAVEFVSGRSETGFRIE